MRENFLVKRGDIVNFDKVWIFDKNFQSDEVEVRAVVKDNAQFTAKGKMVIAKNIKGVNVFLRFKVLLVGKNAKAEVVPELEILSDDVKAGHAASIGRIDQEQLFYLMSRGLSKKESEKLIIKAFLS